MNAEEVTTALTPAEVAKLLREIERLKQQNQEATASGFELITAQTRLQSLLHNATDGVLTINLDGTIQSFNLAAQAIFGYTEGEVITKASSLLIPGQSGLNSTNDFK